MNTESLLIKFYTCFRDRDFVGMAECYHVEAEFSDPVFPMLHGKEIAAMWHMLVSRAKETKISCKNIVADEESGSCQWEAVYPYGGRRRLVHNVIVSEFKFKDGKIYRQTDSFDLRHWLSMAFGSVGRLLGWSGFLKNKVRKFAAKSLRNFIKSNPQYLA